MGGLRQDRAGAGYAALRSLDLHDEELQFPRKLFFVFVLMFVMGFGVLWELLEFGITLVSESFGFDTILTQHGLSDTMLDLVFDLAGGAVVGIYGELYLMEVVHDIREKMLGGM